MTTHPIAHYNKSERLFALYQRLPRSKDKAISLTELMAGYGTDPNKFSSQRKNLENDLNSLHQIFNTIFYSDALQRIPDWGLNISGQTARFYIESSFSIDVIDEHNLFFWEMLNNYTASYLPIAVQQTISDKLTQVRKQDKAKFNNSPLGQWHTHLMTLPSVIKAPTLNTEVLSAIHQALLSNRQLSIRYVKKWTETATERLVYPKGLVFIDNMLYLTGFNPIADSIDDDKLLTAHRNFTVSRIVTADVLNDANPSWIHRDAFTLSNLHQLGRLEPTQQTQITLVLKVQKYACQHLYERPLSYNQSIIELDNTWNQVTATVANTQRLEDWLVSMSQLAVVIKPTSLKQAVLKRLQSAIALYVDND
ncbi:helix-turn-helix transcriptional regulator [Psychrobacter sp. FDAARGOS_221]|uniref:helix-turn-helix transcriptional regulator n=1 Tax=Psychrobacter sp. FDAARGOS_221 TaxID=1975705 RepID=UPI000C9FDFB7|nr:WYL domain-containing protein [Psychrobacter sp. FDAARGOS_221]PNK60667.1 WYL domain-containing protein [Psychrobacter sp. FDAARGOS_221]